MIEFDIDAIRKEITDLDYEDKMAFLEDKESELDAIIEEVNRHMDALSSLRQEIQTDKNDQICNQIQQQLIANGNSRYLKLNNVGNLSLSLGLARIIIIRQFLDGKVKFFFSANRKQQKLRTLIGSILPEYKADGNNFSRQVPEAGICLCVLDLIDKLLNNKESFENI